MLADGSEVLCGGTGRETQSVWQIRDQKRAETTVDCTWEADPTAPMRFLLIAGLLCTLTSLALLLIVLGQSQVLVLLNKERNKLPIGLKRADEELSNVVTFKDSLGKLLDQGGKIVRDLEAEVAKLGPEMETRKTKIAACQVEKKSKADELAAKLTERTETEVHLKPESDAWKEEIKNLRAQVVEYRPICDYVKNNTLAAKLCGTKGEGLS